MIKTSSDLIQMLYRGNYCKLDILHMINENIPKDKAVLTEDQFKLIWNILLRNLPLVTFNTIKWSIFSPRQINQFSKTAIKVDAFKQNTTSAAAAAAAATTKPNKPKSALPKRTLLLSKLIHRPNFQVLCNKMLVKLHKMSSSKPLEFRLTRYLKYHFGVNKINLVFDIALQINSTQYATQLRPTPMDPSLAPVEKSKNQNIKLSDIPKPFRILHAEIIASHIVELSKLDGISQAEAVFQGISKLKSIWIKECSSSTSWT